MPDFMESQLQPEVSKEKNLEEIMHHEAQKSSGEDIKKINDLIKGIPVAMLSTVRADGEIHTRPMVTQQVEFNGNLWFLTRRSSQKMDDLNQTHKVYLSYSSSEKNNYVTLSGNCEIISDRKKAEELWNPLYRTWFPKGLDDPELVCLKVDVQRAEYWDSKSAAMIYLIGTFKAALTGKPYEASEKENKKVDMAS